MDFEKSLRIADKLFDLSESLQEYGITAREHYKQRVSFLKEVVGLGGYFSFHPKVSPDLVGEMQEKLAEEAEKIREMYFKSSDGKYNDIIHLAQHLASTLSNDDVINNKVPDLFHRFAQDLDYNFRSPKLSKLLVRLFGEKSEVVKWFTNVCPKNILVGEDESHLVTVSILPHHLAGMSYYSTYNHGGGGEMDNRMGRDKLPRPLEEQPRE